MSEKPSAEWVEESMRWRGRVLDGKHAHWCADWDFLPVDETTPEWSCCTCFSAPPAALSPSELEEQR